MTLSLMYQKNESVGDKVSLNCIERQRMNIDVVLDKRTSANNRFCNFVGRSTLIQLTHTKLES